MPNQPDPNAAPKGFVAIDSPDGTCGGCTFLADDKFTGCMSYPCAPDHRDDGCHVFFVPHGEVQMTNQPDPNAAPKGFVAIDRPDGTCDGCAFQTNDEFTGCTSYPCSPDFRDDGCNVIFVPRGEPMSNQPDPRSALRKVMYRAYTTGVLAEPKEGWFHTWGVDYEEFDEGVGNCTMAVIEALDGKVVLILPANVIFVPEERLDD